MKMNIKSISAVFAVLFLTMSCNQKKEETAQVAEDTKGETTTTTADVPTSKKANNGIDWDKKLDQFEVLIDKNNELIRRIEKGDSTAIAEQKELQKESEELQKDINPYELKESHLTQAQIDRLADLQKKQREETTSR